ncbi:serine protein kinase RIO [Candidatus Woesearchaeota archaeon]|nr:serine protein kinase RIO [Candidatus Woesearchaeota archaeon]
MAKISREKFKSYQNVFDEFTNRNLFRLISRGGFDGLESPVSIGKESNVFAAKKKNKNVIVKIYRLETCDFNKMYDYIREDPRYLNLKGKKRKIIFAWVQREYRNLLKAREFGVSVPTPLAFKDNILVMEFIGEKKIAPKLKDSIPKNMKKFLDEIIRNMKKLYLAGLVHADLSAFNILNYKERPVLIDFSQCSPIKVSMADSLLERDIRNISNFFKKHGAKLNEEKIKERITNNKI